MSTVLWACVLQIELIKTIVVKMVLGFQFRGHQSQRHGPSRCPTHGQKQNEGATNCAIEFGQQMRHAPPKPFGVQDFQFATQNQPFDFDQINIQLHYSNDIIITLTHLANCAKPSANKTSISNCCKPGSGTYVAVWEKLGRIQSCEFKATTTTLNCRTHASHFFALLP